MPRPASRRIFALLTLGAFLCVEAVAAQASRSPVPRSSSKAKTTSGKPAAKTAEVSPVDPDVVKAESAIAAGQWQDALSLLQSSTARNPRDFRAWYDLGYVHEARNEPKSAIAAYRKALEYKPSLFEAALNLGRLLHLAGENAEAVSILTAATKLKPETAAVNNTSQAWLFLGHAQQSADPAAALLSYQRAAELAPSDAEPLIASALLHQRAERISDAETDLRAALARAPRSVAARRLLADILLEAGKFSDAEPLLRELATASPEDPQPSLALAQLLIRLKRPEEAVSVLRGALAAHPGNPGLLGSLSAALIDAGRYPEAEGLLARAIQGSPKDAGLRYALATALLKQFKYRPAQVELIETLKLDPGRVQAYADLAFAAQNNQDHLLALKALDARARLAEETPATLFIRATSFDHLKEKEKAAESYRRFLSLAAGRYPDQEFQARHRLLALETGGKKK